METEWRTNGKVILPFEKMNVTGLLVAVVIFAVGYQASQLLAYALEQMTKGPTGPTGATGWID